VEGETKADAVVRLKTALEDAAKRKPNWMP